MRRLSDERASLRVAYSLFAILVAIPLAWGSLRGFPSDFLFYFPVIVGLCVVLVALESTIRSLRRRLDDLERRPPPPESPVPPIAPGA